MKLDDYNLLYLVEGECEAALVRAIKNEYIYSGRVIIFNPWTKRAGNLTRNIRGKTICILIFDTDEYRAPKLQYQAEHFF